MTLHQGQGQRNDHEHIYVTHPLSTGMPGLNAIVGRGGSIGRASDSISKDPTFEPPQEHKKNNVEFFPSQKCCADSLSVCPTPVCVGDIRTHKNDHVRAR